MTPDGLFVRHADADSAFQRECLDRMKEKPEGEVQLDGVAWLEDCVLGAGTGG